MAPEKCVYFLRFAWSCVSAKLRKGLAKVSNEFHLLPSLLQQSEYYHAIQK